MHYFYIKDDHTAAPFFKIYASQRNMEYRAVAWPYESIYHEEGTHMHEMMLWLEANAPGFVFSALTNHRGGRLFGGPRYEVWIDDQDAALQFKLTFC
jgi:hypothetical protein